MENKLINVFSSKIFLKFKDTEIQNRYNNLYIYHTKIMKVMRIYIVFLFLLIIMQLGFINLGISEIINSDICTSVGFLITVFVFYFLNTLKKLKVLCFMNMSLIYMNFIQYVVFINIHFIIMKIKYTSYNIVFISIILEYIFRFLWFAYVEFFYINNAASILLSIVYMFFAFFNRNMNFPAIFGITSIRLIIPFGLYFLEMRDKNMFFCYDQMKRESDHLKHLINSINRGMITFNNDNLADVFLSDQIKILLKENIPAIDFLFKNLNIVDENEQFTLTLKDMINNYKNESSIKDILIILKSIKEFTLLGIQNLNDRSYQIYVRYNEFSNMTEFIVNDITYIVERENTRAQLRYKTLFLDKICHEFRNPLSNILNIVDEIKNNLQNNINKYTFDLYNNLGNINALANMMNMLIYDFEFMTDRISSFSSTSKQIVVSTSYLQDVLNDCTHILNTKINLNSKTINVETIIHEDLIFIKSDIIKLKQIILNILSNSFKFTNYGKITIEAKNTIEKNINYILFKITDTGIGIPSYKLDSLKKLIPFYKTEDNNNIYGLGLGLYIVGNLVNLIGKDLEINSDVYKGTQIIFKIKSNIRNKEIKKIKRSISHNKVISSSLSNEFFTNEFINDYKTKSMKNVSFHYSLLDQTNDTILYPDCALILNSSFKNYVKYDSQLLSDKSLIFLNNYQFRILIVDDEKLIRESHVRLINNYFKDKNVYYKIIECCDGAECIYKIYELTMKGLYVDLILSDESMNFICGGILYNLIKQLTNCSIIKPIKFVLVTAYQLKNTLLNVDDIINKPLDAMKIKMLIDKHLDM